MDYSPPRSSILGILQARILEWVSISVFPSPGDHPNPGIKHTSLMSPALASGFSTTSATWHLESKAWILGPFLLTKRCCQVPGLCVYFAHLAPCYCFLPLFSSLPPCSGPFFKPQSRNTSVRGPTPPPRASFQTAPRGSDLSPLGLPEFHLPSPSFSMWMHCWPLSVCLRFSARMSFQQGMNSIHISLNLCTAKHNRC